jgi:Lysophospholipase catalytic domain
VGREPGTQKGGSAAADRTPGDDAGPAGTADVPTTVPATHGGGDAGNGAGDRTAVGGTGICCSGGGIRSAAFNLGALQSLDEAGILRSADYLSAVSGGSYIASAYAVASRHSDPALLAERPALAPGTPEESWIRNHCSYLTNGFVETLQVVAVALVGFLANVVFLATVLWVVARPLGWIYAAWQPGLRVPEGCTAGLSAEEATARGCFDEASFAGPGRWALVAGGCALAAVVIALVVRMFQPPWPLRPTLRRVAVIALAVAAVTTLLTFVVPELVVFARNAFGGDPAAGPMSDDVGAGSASDKSSSYLGLIAGLGGAATVVALVVQVARPARAVVEAGAGVVRRTRSLSRGLRRLVNTLLGALIGPVALAAGALLIVDGGAQSSRPSGGELGLWAVMVGLAGAMLMFADVTSWSLHPFYKWRLARTFAVKRVVDDSAHADPDGKATLLPYEDLTALSSFVPGEFPADREGNRFPELLVCAAVNVSDRGIAPPGSGALSFVFSPTTVGTEDRVVIPRSRPWVERLMLPAQTELATTSYGPLHVATGTYEETVGKRRARDVTLSAAVAISGAAVAPSMGKMTRPLLRFLLALTNVRLGVWLPNPANMPGTTDGRRSRVPANPRQHRLLFEVMGRHRVRSKFLYVTDGGHVENLGLYELLRRRCARIVCLDAAGGSTSTFSTLGEAISLAATQLRACVEIDPTAMAELSDRRNKRNHVTGTITYDDGTTGILVYGKSLVTDDAPWDVRAYATKDPQFPVHPTSDQLYGGETFDAYQSLGRHVGRACAAAFLSPEDDVVQADEERPLRISIDAWPDGPLTGAGGAAGATGAGGVTDVRLRTSGREGP